MPLSAEEHAAYRAALSVADEVDRSGRFRAVLHLLRCAGGQHQKQILSLDVRNVELKEPVGGCRQSAPSYPDGAVVVGGRTVPLDAEAAEEVALYLRRRRRHVRVSLYRVRGRQERWHARVMCAGGSVSRSLHTTDKREAKRLLKKVLPTLARKARARDSGVLFPTSYLGSTSIALSQLRLWANEAIGRRADPVARRRCAAMRPGYRSARRRVRHAD